MAKLQKTLKQRQCHAVRHSAHVAKLTPAEIRLLNNNALASKTDSQSSTKSNSSPSRSRRSTNTTPPGSPDEPPAYQAQVHRNFVSRNNIVNILTPPHTPNGHRRHSQSITHSLQHHPSHVATHGQANGVIHAHRPRDTTQAAFISANRVSSRPSSSGSSTYRGLPTYRGPEVTRTGSVNMLQYAPQQIIKNPLSYFSRPRQSQVSTSPERSRQEQAELSLYRAQSLRNTRARSLPNVRVSSSRQPSPPRLSDSPVSMMANDAENLPAFDPADDPHNQAKSESDVVGDPNVVQTVTVGSQPEMAPPLPDRKTLEVRLPESPEKRKDNQKRFTISAALFGRDKCDYGVGRRNSRN